MFDNEVNFVVQLELCGSRFGSADPDPGPDPDPVLNRSLEAIKG